MRVWPAKLLAPLDFATDFAMPLQIFVYLEQCASYRVSRQILSRRQYAPNKLFVLNNDVRLITRFYGMVKN